jgi:hypothetical protein
MVDYNSQSKLDSGVYKKGIENFNACLANKFPAPESCEVFEPIFDSVKRKIASDTNLTPEELLFVIPYKKFMDSARSMEFPTLWPRYIAREIEPDVFCLKMREAVDEFLEFKKATEPLYTRDSPTRLSSAEEKSLESRRRGFAYLNDSFETALISSKAQLFDQLKKESTTTKLMRTEAAVDLLARNIDSIKSPGEAEKLIAQLASKLNCQTRFVVGPAHDYYSAGPVLLHQAKK